MRGFGDPGAPGGCRLSQVGALDLIVLQESLRFSLKDDLSCFEDIARIADFQGGPCVLLNEKDGDSLLVELPGCCRKISMTTRGGRPMEGSSIIISFGLDMRARPMASISTPTRSGFRRSASGGLSESGRSRRFCPSLPGFRLCAVCRNRDRPPFQGIQNGR